jgi:hypothetical protein
MKNKYLIIIIAIGMIYIFFGVLFKITHLEIGPLTGNSFLTIGFCIEVLTLILFILKLAKNKNNDFLYK